MQREKEKKIKKVKSFLVPPNLFAVPCFIVSHKAIVDRYSESRGEYVSAAGSTIESPSIAGENRKSVVQQKNKFLPSQVWNISTPASVSTF